MMSKQRNDCGFSFSVCLQLDLIELSYWRKRCRELCGGVCDTRILLSYTIRSVVSTCCEDIMYLNVVCVVTSPFNFLLCFSAVFILRCYFISQVLFLWHWLYILFSAHSIKSVFHFQMSQNNELHLDNVQCIWDNSALQYGSHLVWLGYCLPHCDDETIRNELKDSFEIGIESLSWTQLLE